MGSRVGITACSTLHFVSSGIQVGWRPGMSSCSADGDAGAAKPTAKRAKVQRGRRCQKPQIKHFVDCAGIDEITEQLRSFKATFPKEHIPGGLEFMEDQSILPNGPQTPAEVFAWPDRAVRMACSDLCSRQRFVDVLKRGVKLRSDYSGYLCFDIASKYVETAAAKAGLWRREQGGGITCASACDVCSICQDLAAKMDEQYRPQHYTKDINDSLSPAARAKLDEIQQAGQSEAAKALDQACTVKLGEERAKHCMVRCYVKMALHLQENLDEAIPDSVRVDCVLHPSAKGCCVHMDEETSDPENIEVWSAGSICTSFSSYGKHNTVADETTRVFIIWIFKVRRFKPAALFHENVRLFPLGLLLFFLGDIYELGWSEIVSPWMFGVPVNRPRRISFLYLRGGRIVFEGSGADFLATMRVGVAMEADGLLLAPQNVITEARVRRAAARKIFGIDPAVTNDIDLITACRYQRLMAFDKLRQKKQSLTGNFFADTEHNCDWSAAGGFIPTLPTHMDIFSWKLSRFLVSDEYFIAQGHPVHIWKDICPEYPCVFEHLLPDMKDQDKNRLAGNGTASLSNIVVGPLLSRQPLYIALYMYTAHALTIYTGIDNCIHIHLNGFTALNTAHTCVNIYTVDISVYTYIYIYVWLYSLIYSHTCVNPIHSVYSCIHTYIYIWLYSPISRHICVKPYTYIHSLGSRVLNQSARYVLAGHGHRFGVHSLALQGASARRSSPANVRCLPRDLRGGGR